MTDLPAQASPPARDGRIVTFYSFKGGTGRTMALANVAWILAANGHRVLVADWDLESPGLDRFFQPFLRGREVRDEPGIIDMIRDYERVAKKTDAVSRGAVIKELCRVERYAFSLEWDHFQAGGHLAFLSPGKQNRDYVSTLSALDWDNFYESLSGGEFLDALRTDMKARYDYVLIDSRTGLSDIADICTLHLPDVLVDCFTLSTQGIEGAAKVAQLVKQRQLHADPAIRVLPVPMRVDRAEKEKADAGRLVAMLHFAGLPENLGDVQRREYWASIEVPYQAFYAYEETLAVFGDPPGVPSSLLASFERLAAYVTAGSVISLPPMDEQLRERTMAKFTRGVPVSGEQIVIESLAEDQVWADWIATVLRDAGIEVSMQRLGADGETPAGGPGGLLRYSRTLIVVSAAYLARRHRLTLPTETPDLAAYVFQSPALTELATATPVFLAGMSQGEAIERLRRVLGLTGRSAAEIQASAGIRFPGVEPQLLTAPPRNVQFTGRENDLTRLRELLRASGTGRIVIGGLGGVGKTQVAQEYVHRFKTDYDAIWWLDCEAPAFVDASLADLGAQLGNVFGTSVLATSDVAAVAGQVLDALSQGGGPKWLLVYDNADDVDAITPLLPKSGGHVLITSRNGAWADDREASQLPVDVFSRDESVAHLRQWVPSIDRTEAAKIAAAVDDFPLAVATAGAWLADSGYTVSDYLRELERQPYRVLSASELPGQEVKISKVWDVSLNRLAESSPAAAWLLDISALMASRISLRLVYSPEMARVLAAIDPALSETMLIARVVQEIKRLALISTSGGDMVVHGLLQQAVRARMPADRLAAAREGVHGVLVAASPRRDVDDPDTWDRYRLIWPHLAPSEAMSSAAEPVRQLYIDRVRYLWFRGDLERGARLAREADACWTSLVATADDEAAEVLRRQTLQLRFNLGNILRNQGKFAEARELNTGVLAEQTRLLGEHHPHTLMTAGSLAADLRAVGQYREALERDRQIYPAWTALYGEDHQRTLAAANNLAVSLRLNGDIAAALRVDSDTYERRRAALGARDPGTLSSARSIVRDLLEAGEYAEAVARIEETHRLAVEVLGANSPGALEMQVLLGIALRSAGRPAEAGRVFQAALGMLTKRFGADSAEVMACRLSNAGNLLSLDRYKEAASDIRQVLASYAGRLGSRHPHTLVCQASLAAALRFDERHSEAVAAINQAMDGLAEGLGAEHPYTLAAQMSYGTLLADQRDLEQSGQLDARTVDALTQILGPGHPDTLRCRANLLLTREQLGDYAAAARRAEVIDQLAGLLGQVHPTIGTLRAGRRLMRALDPQPF